MFFVQNKSENLVLSEKILIIILLILRNIKLTLIILLIWILEFYFKNIVG